MNEIANRICSPASTDRTALARRTITIVAGLSRELRGDRNDTIVATAGSDLGFDSLGQAELIIRLNQAFQVQ